MSDEGSVTQVAGTNDFREEAVFGGSFKGVGHHPEGFVGRRHFSIRVIDGFAKSLLEHFMIPLWILGRIFLNRLQGMRYAF